MLTELFKKLWFKGNWQNKQKHKNIISMVLIYHHDRAKIYHGDPVWPSHVDKSACRRVLWILLVLSRLSPRCGFLPRLTWTHPPPLPPPSSSSFRLDLSLCCGGLNSAHASLNTGLALHILLSFRWLFPFFLWCLPSVCSVASIYLL